MFFTVLFLILVSASFVGAIKLSYREEYLVEKWLTTSVLFSILSLISYGMFGR